MSGVELWWLGQSGFRLRDPEGGPVIFIDPFLSEDERRNYPPLAPPEVLAPADLVLCTHEHDDHFDQPALKKAAAVPDARFSLVVPCPIVDKAVQLGLPRPRVIGAQPYKPIEFAGVRIDPLPACHGINVSDAYSFGKELSSALVRYLGYVITLGGVRVYHSGDTIPYNGQIERVRDLQPHLALLPINGRDYFREKEHNIVGNMNPREVVHLAVEIGVEALVPLHWDLMASNPGFPGDLVGYAARYAPELTLVILGRDARFTYLPQLD